MNYTYCVRCYDYLINLILFKRPWSKVLWILLLFMRICLAHLASWMSVRLNPQGDALLLGAGCGTKPCAPPGE